MTVALVGPNSTKTVLWKAYNRALERSRKQHETERVLRESIATQRAEIVDQMQAKHSAERLLEVSRDEIRYLIAERNAWKNRAEQFLTDWVEAEAEARCKRG